MQGAANACNPTRAPPLVHSRPFLGMRPFFGLVGAETPQQALQCRLPVPGAVKTRIVASTEGVERNAEVLIIEQPRGDDIKQGRCKSLEGLFRRS